MQRSQPSRWQNKYFEHFGPFFLSPIVSMTEQKIGKDGKYGEENTSVMNGRAMLMTNLSSVSLITLMKKYHHLSVPLFLSHALSLTLFVIYSL